MPTLSEITAAAEVGEDVLAAASRGGGLSLLGIAGESAGRIAAAGKPAIAAGLEDAAVLNRNFLGMRSPCIVIRGGAPSWETRTFDSADELGRIFTARRNQVAGVVRLPRNPSDPFSFGSGIPVRADGLTLATRHAVMDSPRGDIWVRLFGQPVPSFRAGILDQLPNEDLVLLKPLTPLGRPVSHVPISEFSTSAAPGSRLVTFGVQNTMIDAAGNITGDLHIAEGRILDKVPMRFAGQQPRVGWRTTVPGEHGMSAGGTYELRTGKLAGAMRAGFDYKYSDIAPADQLRNFIARNWGR